jgi:hypothetical protein
LASAETHPDQSGCAGPVDRARGPTAPVPRGSTVRSNSPASSPGSLSAGSCSRIPDRESSPAF